VEENLTLCAGFLWSISGRRTLWVAPLGKMVQDPSREAGVWHVWR